MSSEDQYDWIRYLRRKRNEYGYSENQMIMLWGKIYAYYKVGVGE